LEFPVRCCYQLLSDWRGGPFRSMIAPGTIVGDRYRVSRSLGGGGMKQVYLAEDTRLDNRRCALAEMIDSFTNPKEQQTAATSFQREADLLAKLSHARIPHVYDHFSGGNRHFLVMEFVEGTTIEERLKASPNGLSEATVIEVALQVLEALEYLHSRRRPVVFRDLKPSNIMLSPDGEVKLVDFGIARLFIPQKTATMVGTQGYAAPEQYEGKSEPRTDLYALGATMLHLLTGWDPAIHPPFMFPAIETLRADLNPALAILIGEALALDLDQRIGSATEFRRRLRNLQEPGGRGTRYKGAAAVLARPLTLDIIPAIAEAAPTVPCARCAKSIPVDSRFCPYCSTDLENLAMRGLTRRPNRGVWPAGLAVGVVLLAAIGFAAVVYSDPSLQSALGLKPFVDNLPWKRAERLAAARLAAARAHPLSFERLTLALSTGSGQPTAPPATNFKETEITRAQYLSWRATFDNGLAGLGSDSERVAARLYDPAGNQIASSEAEQFLSSNVKTIDFSAVVFVPGTAGKTPGQYRIALYRGDEMLGQQQFAVIEDLVAAPEPKANLAPTSKPKRPAKRHGLTVAALRTARHQPSQPRTPYRIELDPLFTESQAKAMLDRMHSLGYTATTTPVDQGDGETRYKVEVGAYKSEDEANDAADVLHARYGSSFSGPPP
jgi:serine/threonine protein kinase